MVRIRARVLITVRIREVGITTTHTYSFWTCRPLFVRHGRCCFILHIIDLHKGTTWIQTWGGIMMSILDVRMRRRRITRVVKRSRAAVLFVVGVGMELKMTGIGVSTRRALVDFLLLRRRKDEGRGVHGIGKKILIEEPL